MRVQSVAHPGSPTELLQPAPNIKVFKGKKLLVLSVSPGKVLLEGIKALPADRNPALFFRLLAVGKQEAAFPVYIVVGQGQELRYPEPGITKMVTRAVSIGVWQVLRSFCISSSSR